MSTSPPETAARLRPRSLERYLLPFVLAPLTLLLAIEAVLSLRWRMVHDTPLLHYAAWQVAELGRAPYREVLETSMPGSLLIHIGIGRVFGWGDLGFQCANLVWILVLLALTWGILAQLGRRAAWAGVVVYGLVYLANGPWMQLQRDSAAILPIVFAIWLATGRHARRRPAQFLVGVAFGAAVCVKPHLGIGFPLVALYPWARDAMRGDQRWIHALWPLGLGAAGLAIPVAICAAWIFAHGAGAAFVEMLTQYLPLHLQLTGDHHTIDGFARTRHGISGLRELGGHAVWLAPLFICALRAVDPRVSRPHRELLALLTLLACAYALVPAVAGQFWDYHWMPFQFFAAISIVGLAGPAATMPSASERTLSVVLFATLVFFAIRLPIGFSSQLAGDAPPAPKDGVVDELALWLDENTQPGDEVQPLDWTGGAVHALLRSGTPCGSRFLYDYHFYHHPDRQVVRRWRGELLQNLEFDPPRYVIRFDGQRVFGTDTADSWPALDAQLSEFFEPVHEGSGWQILESRR